MATPIIASGELLFAEPFRSLGALRDNETAILLSD